MEILYEPILITGCARSGLSMTAGVINICGGFSGQTIGPTKYNKQSRYENYAITNNFIKPILLKMKVDQAGQNPLPKSSLFKEIERNYVERFRNDIINLMVKEGYEDGRWFYKDSRMSLMWPLWNKAFPRAKWVLVRRQVDDIISSCMRTGYMRGYKNYAGWLGWVAEYERRFQEMHDEGLNIHEVWPQRAINGDLTEVQMVINNLRLDWKYNKVKEFISPSSWHRNKDRRG